jgi:hypothetical protein
MSSRNTTGFSGALGSSPAAPMTVSVWPSLTPAFAQSWSSRRMPPLTMTFIRSGGTPVAPWIAALNALAGSSVFSGKGYVFPACLIVTDSVGIVCGSEQRNA